MSFSKKKLFLKEPELFVNFHFKITIRQYFYLLKVFIMNFYRETYKFLKNLKWK